MAEQKYLIQDKTNRVYGWSKDLAARDDMKPFEYPQQQDKDLTDIVDAIGLLDPDNKLHYTVRGKPDAKVLGELLGRRVPSEERDAAYELFKAGE